MMSKLSKWSKEAKKAMIDNDTTYRMMSKDLDVSREYLSMIINGNKKSDQMIKRISDYLGIKDSYDDVAHQE